MERVAREGKRTGGGSRPFGYKINWQDLGEGAPRRRRIVDEELEPAEKELIEEAATRVLRGESLRSIAMDWNERGVKTVGGGTWQGSMIKRVLMSPRIAGLKEHRGEIVGEAKWPAIIDRAKHERLVGLLKDESRRPANYGRPRVYPLVGLLRCGSCGGKLITYLSRQGQGYGCRKDENLKCDARVRIAAEPLEAYAEGYVIEMWRNPQAVKIAQSDEDRMKSISKISSEMAQLQEQKNEALRMKLRGEVDLKTYRAVARELDAAHDKLHREHKSLTSEAAMPELPDPSLAWDDLSAQDRRTLTELLVDKDHHRSAPEQDRRGRQAALRDPRYPVPRSPARG
jgi:hypothetical protein